MKKKQSIAIDLDSTLNCLDKYWIEERYNKDYNDNLKREDMICWDCHIYVKPECGYKIYDYLKEPGFFRNLGVQSNSQDVTKWLKEYFDLYVVTAYCKEAVVDKVDWLNEFFPHIDTKDIIFCNNKGLIKADFMIDDGGHNIEVFTGIGLVFDAPWNRYLDESYNRFYNWTEIKGYFKYFLGIQ